MAMLNSQMVYIYTGWWWLVVEPTPLKNMKVSWNDDIPIYMEK